MDLLHKLKQVSEEAERLLAIVEIGKLLNSTIHLDQLLEIILDTALQNLQAERGTLYLIDFEKKELWSKVLKGEETIRLPIGKGIAGTVAATGETIFLTDAYDDPRFNPEFDKKSGFRTSSMLCTPMKNREGRMIGVFQILNKREGEFEKSDIEFLDTLSLDACIAIENARLHEADLVKQRILKELEVAATIQRMILPKEITSIPGLDLAGLNVPSRQVGGDYYDAVPLPDGRVALVMADVSGKSVPGALLVSTLQASLRAYLESPFELAPLVTKLNRVILKNSTDDKFITFFIGIVDTQKNTLEYLNAGHNPPLLMTKGQLIKLTKGGIPLGMIGFDDYAAQTLNLHSGDTLVLFTDGITEAVSPNDDMYDDARLENLVQNVAHSSAEDLKKIIYNDVMAFVNGAEQADDITLLIAKYQ
ncbi:SpoIIE family protein phosphatase [bacterium]|nr:SpoIIE family protein phosphatase [bacterium]NUN47063.1 SpoIIE family protein phosphatase [bacterium]